MAGLTNYARYTLIRQLVGEAGSSALSMYLGVLVSLPTTDGTLGGGDLTSLGAEEWPLSRVLINTEASATEPYGIRQLGLNGGVEISVVGGVTYSIATTAALPSDTTIVGLALYDAATGGNMLVFDELDSPRVVSPGTPVEIETNKLKIGFYRDLTA